jgi:hypothetical protein
VSALADTLDQYNEGMLMQMSNMSQNEAEGIVGGAVQDVQAAQQAQLSQDH